MLNTITYVIHTRSDSKEDDKLNANFVLKLKELNAMAVCVCTLSTQHTGVCLFVHQSF